MITISFMRKSPGDDVMALSTSDRLTDTFEWIGGTPGCILQSHLKHSAFPHDGGGENNQKKQAKTSGRQLWLAHLTTVYILWKQCAKTVTTISANHRNEIHALGLKKQREQFENMRTDPRFK